MQSYHCMAQWVIRICNAIRNYIGRKLMFVLIIIIFFSMEQTLLRQWTWIPCGDCLNLANLLTGKQPQGNETAHMCVSNCDHVAGKLPVLLVPSYFHCNSSLVDQQQTPSLHISPELIRAFLLTIFHSLKITGIYFDVT